MKIYPSDPSNVKVLAYDLFELLGLNALSEEEKEKYIDQFIVITVDFFLQGKISTNLSAEQMKSLMSKYGEVTAENFDAFLTEISELVPDSAELFTEALAETKLRVVSDHTKRLKQKWEEKLNAETDEAKKTDYQSKITQCEENLKQIIAGNFEQVNLPNKV